uniref:Integrase catalytic domain-containing protein n=1 Tax=Biomphalaria glabrata TaxID=6526 RepID=A0A2C9M8B9_BIOGL
MRSHNQENNPNEISTESQDPLQIKTDKLVSEQKNDPDLIKLIESEAPPRRGFIQIGEDGVYVREIHLKAEAIPLKRISSEDVGDALTAIFARTGYPRIILSDQGTQFKSNEFTQFCKTLNIKQQFAARFHPQANGMCKRLNSTLKTMLNKVVQDNPTDWDKLINLILFAYREVTHTTTGFSPFEMLYGSPVRGPMSLYRDFL